MDTEELLAELIEEVRGLREDMANAVALQAANTELNQRIMLSMVESGEELVKRVAAIEYVVITRDEMGH